MDLLVSRGLASPFTPGAAVICKRSADGSTIPLAVDPSQPLSALESKLKLENAEEISGLSFYQAQDGCMHISVWPSAGSEASSHTVYSRSNPAQPQLTKKKVSDGTMTLAELSKQLCV